MSQELDPYQIANFEAAELSWLYADGLAGADLSAPETGSLCTRPAVRAIAGGKASYHYELRDGVQWHDGKPMIAQDVADCFERLRTGAWGRQRPFSLVEHIEVRGDRNFTAVLREDDPQFSRAFFTPTGSPSVPLIRPGPIPIGTGPFRLRERLADAWTFERWNRTPRGMPAAARGRLSYIGDDRTQEVMLASGETDVALFVSGVHLAEQKLPFFERRPGVGYAIVNADGSLNTPALRQAFAAAVDRREIAGKVYHGMTAPYDSIVAPSVPGSGIRLAHEYDPEFARDTFRRLPPRIEIAVTDGPPEQIGLLMQAHLTRVGARASIRKYATQAFLALNGPLRTGRFDVALFGDYFSLDPDLTASWGCEARAPLGGNFSRLCDAQLDRLALAGDLPGALGRLRGQAVVVPLVALAQFVGLSRRLRGARNVGDLVPTVYGCAEWSIA